MSLNIEKTINTSMCFFAAVIGQLGPENKSVSHSVRLSVGLSGTICADLSIALFVGQKRVVKSAQQVAQQEFCFRT